MVCEWLHRRAANPADPPSVVVAKKVILPGALACLLTIAFVLPFVTGDYAFLVGLGICGVGCGILVGYPLATRTIPVHVVECGVLISMCGVMIIDLLNAAARGLRCWALAVVCLDILLIAGGRNSVQGVGVCSTVVYLLAVSVETCTRLGLFDIPMFDVDRQVIFDADCSCSNPPCAVPVDQAARGFTLYALVFLVDFYLTRFFSETTVQQRSLLEASVRVAEQVSAALARFDLERAEASLASAGASMPPELAGSFEILLGNLSSYKPFLPHSVLPQLDDAAVADSSCSIPQTDHEPRADTSGSFSGRDSETLSASGRKSRPQITLRHAPAYKVVTSLHMNTTGFLVFSAQQSIPAMSRWFSSSIQSFIQTVSSQNGVSDTLVGDHFTALFNAVRLCARHAVAATRAAEELGRNATGDGASTECDPARSTSTKERSARSAVSKSQESAGPVLGDSRVSVSMAGSVGRAELGSTTAAVCTGRVLCGDFGSSEAQRFMAFGKVSSQQLLVERVAARLRQPVLLDTIAHSDTAAFWEFKLLRVAAYRKMGAEITVQLWSKKGAKESVDHEEWMYQLDAAASSSEWTAYNAAMLSWAAGAEASSVLAELDQLRSGDAEVCAAAHNLRSWVTADCPRVAVLDDAGSLLSPLEPTSRAIVTSPAV